MLDSEVLGQAFSALDNCDAALNELETRCCEPSRSPDMRALATTLADARGLLEGLTADAGTVEALRTGLRGAAAQTRRLQAECCAPGRMPFYAVILEELDGAGRFLERALGAGE